ncbi:hypothetical protein L596_005507 [Steinernema carpocapsae]|uniref:Uncharacterized protein n=1 Tax=Steinernema carpocapsae TaxID=34508 RepID=A0A4U8V446_STECR|nr:hypothetical protein L596_005507 [Steinernema carpocapsae]
MAALEQVHLGNAGIVFLCELHERGHGPVDSNRIRHPPDHRNHPSWAGRRLHLPPHRSGQRRPAEPLVRSRHRSHSRRQGISHINRQNFRSAVWFFAVLTSVFVAATTILVMCCCCRDRKKGEYAVKRRELERGHHYDDEHRAFIEYQYGTEPKK